MGNPATRKFLRKVKALEEVKNTVPPTNNLVKQEENIVNKVVEIVDEPVLEQSTVKISKKKKAVQSDSDVV